MTFIQQIAVFCAAAGLVFAQNEPLEPSKKVAFLISPDAVTIDFAGPWGVFQAVALPGSTMEKRIRGFQLFTVAESDSPVRVSGGMTVVPDYTFENTPQPDIIVVPAQRSSRQMIEWVRSASRNAELTMSVCNGAFLLAEAGLLDGKGVALHHGFYEGFAAKFPKVEVKRGLRFVDEGKIATSAGLTAGLDLALHAVARFYGRGTAARTADMLEHEPTTWQNPAATQDARWLRTSASSAGKGDTVCGMNVPADAAITAVHRGKTYHFCSDRCKRTFSESPETYAK